MKHWNVDFNSLKAKLASIVSEDPSALNPVELIQSPSVSWNKPGEYLGYMFGFVEKTSPRTGNSYYVIQVAATPQPPEDEKKLRSIMVNVKSKDGALLQYSIQFLVKKITGRIIPMQAVSKLGMEIVGPLLDAICQGPCVVKTVYKLPYLAQVEKGVWHLLDPKTNTQHEACPINFGSIEEAKHWLSVPSYEGGGADIKTAGFPELELVGPGDGYELSEEAEKLFSLFSDNPTKEVPKVMPEPPPPQETPKFPPWGVKFQKS